MVRPNPSHLKVDIAEKGPNSPSDPFIHHPPKHSDNNESRSQNQNEPLFQRPAKISGQPKKRFLKILLILGFCLHGLGLNDYVSRDFAFRPGNAINVLADIQRAPVGASRMLVTGSRCLRVRNRRSTSIHDARPAA
jgi:hypothetical protein